MIDYKQLEVNKEKFKTTYYESKPFECLVIDNFLTSEALNELKIDELMKVKSTDEQSSDLIFAKNKIENPKLEDISPQLRRLKEQLLSSKFQKILREIVGKDVFIDPTFTGGGLHQGAKGSYLDMHADFTHHPNEKKWIRELNLLLYLNRDWRTEYGGCLDLKNNHTGEMRSIEPIENRMVIMLTKPHTIHGYKAIQFPEDKMRISIASYAYVIADDKTNLPYASTSWHPENRNRRVVSRLSNILVPLKQRMFGSRTVKRARRENNE